MRDNTIHQYLTNIVNYIKQVEQSARLGITGESVRGESLQRLLIKKGLITEEEMRDAIGEVIREVNTPKPEEAPKVELTTPTAEQVSEVQKSVVEEPKQ